MLISQEMKFRTDDFKQDFLKIEFTFKLHTDKIWQNKNLFEEIYS